jgi:hypothetical protein
MKLLLLRVEYGSAYLEKVGLGELGPPYETHSIIYETHSIIPTPR